MVTTSYSRPEQIKSKIGYSDRSLDDVDIQEYIEEGHRTLEARVGRTYAQNIRVRENRSNEVITDYNLKLRPVLSVEYVEVQGTKIDESKYSVDENAGVLSFNDTFAEEDLLSGMEVAIRYVPMIYRDLEVWYATSALLASKKVQLDQNQVETSREQAAQEASKLESVINQSLSPGTVSDGRVRRGFR